VNLVGWSILDPLGTNANAQDLGRTIGGGGNPSNAPSATPSPTAGTTVNPVLYVALAVSLGALGYVMLSKKKNRR